MKCAEKRTINSFNSSLRSSGKRNYQKKTQYNESGNVFRLKFYSFNLGPSRSQTTSIVNAISIAKKLKSPGLQCN